jgi:hypothetical protein
MCNIDMLSQKVLIHMAHFIPLLEPPPDTLTIAIVVFLAHEAYEEVGEEHREAGILVRVFPARVHYRHWVAGVQFLQLHDLRQNVKRKIKRK